MADDTRPYVRREARMLFEWLKKFHPTSPQWIQVRLGEIPQSNMLYSGIRRYADSIFLTDHTINIVEASMKPKYEKVAQLELYRSIFPDTPEFSTFKDYQVHLIYLTTLDDKYTRDLAEGKGIEYIIYSPAWVKQYWKDVISGLNG